MKKVILFLIVVLGMIINMTAQNDSLTNSKKRFLKPSELKKLGFDIIPTKEIIIDNKKVFKYVVEIFNGNKWIIDFKNTYTSKSKNDKGEWFYWNFLDTDGIISNNMFRITKYYENGKKELIFFYPIHAKSKYFAVN